MQQNKSQLILSLYNEFYSKKKVCLEQFCSETNISAQTFHRYVNEVRIYFSNHYIPMDIKYDRVENCYYLIKLDNINI